MVEAVPKGTKAAGRRLWTSVVAGYELDEHELALLRESVRTVDLLEDLDALVKRDGAVISSPQGMKAHPAAVEARQQRIALARLLATLRMPAGDDEQKPSQLARGPRRSGVRGPYRMGPAA